MYDIILASTSTFAKTFKADISKLLVLLRRKNLLCIKDDTITLAPNNTQIVPFNNSLHDVLSAAPSIEDLFNVFNREMNRILLIDEIKEEYRKTNFLDKLSLLIKYGSTIDPHKYYQVHTIYLFLCINDPNNQESLIPKYTPLLKPGYSFKIHKRVLDLERELRCKVFIIDVRTVLSEETEKEFHNFIKKYQPALIYDLRIKDKIKEEYYYFNQFIVRSFLELKEHLTEFNDSCVTDIVFANRLKNQFLDFSLCMSNIFNCYNLREDILNNDVFDNAQKQQLLMNYMQIKEETRRQVISNEIRIKLSEDETHRQVISNDVQIKLSEEETKRKAMDVEIANAKVKKRELDIEILKLQRQVDKKC